jgi:2-oxoglutarate dehydrogenase complex dehydrogenase (E1) component-like enzyme
MLKKVEDAAEAAKMSMADFVYDYVASGKTLVDLADEVGYSRSHISRHLNKIPEVKEALEKARLEAADALAEQTIKLADDLAARLDRGEDVKNERISVLREQTSSRKWWAATANPGRYGKPDTSITINLGDLHLDALRKTRSNVIDITPAEASDDE